MTAANILIERAVLPEIIGCWFTKPRGETESVSASSSSSTSGKNTYCYCNGVDDGSKMICCDNMSVPVGSGFTTNV